MLADLPNLESFFSCSGCCSCFVFIPCRVCLCLDLPILLTRYFDESKTFLVDAPFALLDFQHYYVASFSAASLSLQVGRHESDARVSASLPLQPLEPYKWSGSHPLVFDLLLSYLTFFFYFPFYFPFLFL